MSITEVAVPPRLYLREKRLSALLGELPDLITIGDAARLFDLSEVKAAKLLSTWTRRGLLQRRTRGVYARPPEGRQARPLDEVLPLINELFSPCYIGGSTAAKYWGLGFCAAPEITVITAQAVRTTTVVHDGVEFRVKHKKEYDLFGTKSVGYTQSAVSDIHRTIIDMLDDPGLVNGIQHVADCLSAYLSRPDRDELKLLEYADRLKNGAVFKRLGFLAERNNATYLMTACKKRLSQGISKLDPTVVSPRLVRRWRLWVSDLQKNTIERHSLDPLVTFL